MSAWIPEIDWVIILSESGSVNLFPVDHMAPNFEPGKPVPRSHQDFVGGEEKGVIIARLNTSEGETKFIESILAHQKLFPRDSRESALSLDGLTSFMRAITSGIREHGFKKTKVSRTKQSGASLY